MRRTDLVDASKEGCGAHGRRTGKPSGTAKGFLPVRNSHHRARPAAGRCPGSPTAGSCGGMGQRRWTGATLQIQAPEADGPTPDHRQLPPEPRRPRGRGAGPACAGPRGEQAGPHHHPRSPPPTHQRFSARAMKQPRASTAARACPAAASGDGERKGIGEGGGIAEP